MQLQAYYFLFMVFNSAGAYHLHQIVYGRYQNFPSAPINTLIGDLKQIKNSFGSANAHANKLSGIFSNSGKSNSNGLGSFSNFQYQKSSNSGGSNAFSSTRSGQGTDGYGPSNYQYSTNSRFGGGSYSAYGKHEQRPTKPSHPAIDCRSDVLSCVPSADCENDPYKGTAECPPHFTKLGGACYYFSNADFVRERSAPDSRKFCEDIGGHLLWLENNQEFQSVSQVIAEKGNLIYWSDGFYDKRKDHWEWYNNSQVIDIRRLHYESYLSNPGLTSPQPNENCLLVGSGLDAGICYSPKPFVCKIGEFTNYCERSSLKKCCFSPSYDFYRTSRLGLAQVKSSLSHASFCYVLFDMEVITCEEAFKVLGNSAFRIKKSIYYLKSADLGCGKDLEAVISSEDLHRNIVHSMMLRELRPFKIKIGLKFQQSTYSGSYVWSNGKSVDYYENQYWGSGQPIISGSSSCVMYQLTGTYGSYLWHTQSDSRECTHPNNYVLCELPIRNKKEERVKAEEGCGIRKTRGALARSFLANHDFEEAKLGEMPWHVAIKRVVINSGRVHQEFLCSGVLVSKNSILTSAHCVQGRQRELIVSLGENDLLAGSRRKLLQPVSRTVKEVIIHPQYSIGSNDLAILQLSLSVDIPSLPHVSTTCLPDQQLLNTPGEWECLATGWQTTSASSYRQQVLLRIEVDFVPQQVCARHTTVASSSYRSNLYYGQHKSNDPKLLCTEPWDSTTCLDDPTQILICKKATSSLRRDPFDSGRQYEDTDNNHNRYSHGSTQSEHYKHESTNIINTYGENRYNVDKWYVIGLGYKASKCQRYEQISVFTPVHEYLAFIHASIDHTDRSFVPSTVSEDDDSTFSKDLPVEIPEVTAEKNSETTIAPVTPDISDLNNLVSEGKRLVIQLKDLRKINKVLEAVKTLFDLLQSTFETFLQSSVVDDIVRVFRRRRSADTDITSIIQKLTELQNKGFQNDNQLIEEIEEFIQRLKNFINKIEIENLNVEEIQNVKEVLENENKLTSLIKNTQEEITQAQRKLATINEDIGDLGGVVVKVPQDDNFDSSNELVVAIEAAKRDVIKATKKFEAALAKAERTAAEEEAAKKAAIEETARIAAEEAAKAAKKEEEAARKAEEAKKARQEMKVAKIKAQMEKAAAAEAEKKAQEAAEEAKKKAQEAAEAKKKAQEAAEAERLADQAAEAKELADQAAEAEILAAEAEAEKLAAQAEAARKAEEEKTRQEMEEAKIKAQMEKEAAAEAEKKAQEAAEEAKKTAQEAAAMKKAAEEAKRKAQEAAKAAKAERLAAKAEAERLAAQAEVELEAVVGDVNIVDNDNIGGNANDDIGSSNENLDGDDSSDTNEDQEDPPPEFDSVGEAVSEVQNNGQDPADSKLGNDNDDEILNDNTDGTSDGNEGNIEFDATGNGNDIEQLITGLSVNDQDTTQNAAGGSSAGSDPPSPQGVSQISQPENSEVNDPFANIGGGPAGNGQDLTIDDFNALGGSAGNGQSSTEDQLIADNDQETTQIAADSGFSGSVQPSSQEESQKSEPENSELNDLFANIGGGPAGNGQGLTIDDFNAISDFAGNGQTSAEDQSIADNDQDTIQIAAGDFLTLDEFNGANESNSGNDAPKTLEDCLNDLGGGGDAAHGQSAEVSEECNEILKSYGL